MPRIGINLPNLISLARLLVVPLAIWLILDAEYAAAFWVFVAAGISDGVDGFIAKHFNRRTQLGALLDPIADKALVVSLYIALGMARQLWEWLVILVVFRDALIIGGFIFIQAFAVPKHYDPLFVSKINTLTQIVLIAYVLGRLAFGGAAGLADTVLGLVVAATTVASGLSYLVRWARILTRSEQAL